jgi:hypothetical protein
MIATIITILSILVLVLGFSVINLLRKQETAEDIVVSYMKYLDNISKTIEISEKKLKELDHKGSFESDDEIGFFFKSVKQIQDILNDFKVLRIKE